MNLARVAAAAVASWIVYLGVSFLVHGVLLRGIYMQHVGSMRPEAEANAILPIGFGFALVGFFAFVYAFARGHRGGGVSEGVTFGVLTGIVLCAFGSIWDYMVWPVSPALAALWMADFIVEFALYGAIVGAIYKPAVQPVRMSARV